MILDSLDKLEQYASLNPLFPVVADFIKKTDLNSLEPGTKIELKGKDLVVNVQNPQAKSKEAARLEAHQRFIDIQIPLSVTETMGYQPVADCKEPDGAYNAEKDIIFYKGGSRHYIDVVPGMFVIFFPQDAHAPCINEEAESIRKIVVKVSI
jgi:YhcH/YjgK/YiaL family protein